MEILSNKTLEIFNKSIPSLTHALHKGSCGKIAIIGGCLEYTGAPFYAAYTTLKLGGDLAYIICTEEAAIPIKTYSSEIIVYPFLKSLSSSSSGVNKEDSENCANKISQCFSRINAIVIGPGLGRDEQVLDTVSKVMRLACQQNIPLVIDGDGLFLLSQQPNLIEGNKNVLLTPNHIEFVRLWNAVMSESISISQLSSSGEREQQLAKKFKNTTIFHKGEIDIITDGNSCLKNDEYGCCRRCGGQGDLVAGSNGLFAHWILNFNQNISNIQNPFMYSAYASSMVVRLTQKNTFNELGRTMTTPDLINNLGKNMKLLFSSF